MVKSFAWCTFQTVVGEIGPKQGKGLKGWKKQRSEIEDAEVAEFVGQGNKEEGTEWKRSFRHQHRGPLKVLFKLQVCRARIQKAWWVNTLVGFQSHKLRPLLASQ